MAWASIAFSASFSICSAQSEIEPDSGVTGQFRLRRFAKSRRAPAGLARVEIVRQRIAALAIGHDPASEGDFFSGVLAMTRIWGELAGMESVSWAARRTQPAMLTGGCQEGGRLAKPDAGTARARRVSNFPLSYRLSWLPRLLKPSLAGNDGTFGPLERDGGAEDDGAAGLSRRHFCGRQPRAAGDRSGAAGNHRRGRSGRRQLREPRRPATGRFPWRRGWESGMR